MNRLGYHLSLSSIIIVAVFFISPILNSANALETELYHRLNSQNMIIDATKNAKNSAVLFILGAGQCSEIPLEHLGSIFERIYLFDINPDECHLALKRSNLHRKTNFHVVNFDFSFGISQFIHSHIEEFILAASIEAVDSRDKNLGDLFNLFFESISVDLVLGGKPDMVISSLLVSQILNRLVITTRNFEKPQVVIDRLHDTWTKAVSKLQKKIFVRLNPSTIYYADTLGTKLGSLCEKNLFDQIKDHLACEYMVMRTENWPYHYTHPPLLTTVASMVLLKSSEGAAYAP